ncbi:hypothetical protein [Rhodococcus artemisiae]|uniref:Uncharacterized protein n=1 Tax=Rhodococcus artemisiae TaxID=714159 RepID=A0ABU7LJQ0_9NOCA|nr:hypothetical protein [Rhodococcus artemisiae]MEE2061783.1 hypothetical protein [Rhodococcus artemisiae]
MASYSDDIAHGFDVWRGEGPAVLGVGQALAVDPPQPGGVRDRSEPGVCTTRTAA